ncbi:MAG: Si-specific NAD(P)(+) transhydrogenase [Polyangiaceae bacterium]|nr:Si-specific NAD(P)(+) transhydrogenase [Polyangiaceae bacterium]MCE7894215.1 Si-specific NAD(P)(+) transhydrogenase [Sorangiineae bacterium PRO1]MCL4753696.1 Si-specific NAD(P)(+) transhydrogenase [Myxococcales bacterium]
MGSESAEHFDLVVIGSGPAGEKGAAQAAYFGKRVAVVESEPEPGGAAVHTGTLPSKTLRETALYVSGYRARNLYGVAVELASDATVPALIARKNAIAAQASRTIRENLARHTVTYVRGHGSFEDANTVLVKGPEGSRRLHGDFVLIATGSRPHRPSDIDFTDPGIDDSDEILGIEKLPASLAILGGGVIGCEYACMFAALGVKVTLVDARPDILPFLDAEIVERLREAMGNLGIRIVLGQRWNRVAREGSVIVADLGAERLETEYLLFAAGRIGNTESLGLDRIGVTPNARGYLQVDATYRTSVPNVLAAGDVIGFPALASASMEQGRVAVCKAFGFDYKQAVAEIVPYGIYTIPEVSSVGETEQSARVKGMDVVVGRALYRNNARGQITGDVEGITKLVVERGSRRVVGVHVIGERATELVHIGQTALHCDAQVDLFIEMVFNYPTLAESYKYAAYECLGALARSP